MLSDHLRILQELTGQPDLACEAFGLNAVHIQAHPFDQARIAQGVDQALDEQLFFLRAKIPAEFQEAA